MLVCRGDFRELLPSDSGVLKNRDIIRKACSKILQLYNTKLKAHMESRIHSTWAGC